GGVAHGFNWPITASLPGVGVMAGGVGRFAPAEPRSDQAFDMAGQLLAAHLAPAAALAADQQQAIAQLHARLGVDLGLFDKERRLLAAARAALPMPPAPPNRGRVVWRAPPPPGG